MLKSFGGREDGKRDYEDAEILPGEMEGQVLNSYKDFALSPWIRICPTWISEHSHKCLSCDIFLEGMITFHIVEESIFKLELLSIPT